MRIRVAYSIERSLIADIGSVRVGADFEGRSNDRFVTLAGRDVQRRRAALVVPSGAPREERAHRLDVPEACGRPERAPQNTEISPSISPPRSSTCSFAGVCPDLTASSRLSSASLERLLRCLATNVADCAPVTR